MSGRAAKMVALALETNNNEVNINKLKINVPYEILVENTDNDHFNNIIMPDKENLSQNQQNFGFENKCLAEKPHEEIILDPNEIYMQIAPNVISPNNLAVDEIHNFDNDHGIPVEIEDFSEFTTTNIIEEVYIATSHTVSNDLCIKERDKTNNLDYIITEVEDFQEITNPKENTVENNNIIILQNTSDLHDLSLEEKDDSINDLDYIPIELNAIDGDEERPQETENEINEHTNKRKKRKKVADPETWGKNVNKKKRMLGKDYIGYTRTKDGVVKHDMKRSERAMGPACTSTFCKKATNRFCHLLSEEIRQNIFETFWAMNWEQKKLYVLHMTSYHAPKRSYTENPSRRTGSFDYFLKIEVGKHQVCKKLFLNTLGIKEKMVRQWVSEGNTFGMMKRQESKNEEKVQRRSNSAASLELEKRRHLEFFFNALPKIESHYCRSRSEKHYLEQDFKTKAEVYEVYKTVCLEEEVLPLSLCTFLKLFDEMNIGLFKPRKDQCDLCCSFKMKHLDEITYNAHILAKDHAREEKNQDKKKCEEKLIHCFTMDVEAVKLCPQLQASSLYYKTKLQVHNFTIYNLETHECSNFVWNESEGELCSSIFATCVFKFLQAVVEKEMRPIVLYSDSCGYQNKNCTLANALSLFSSRYDTIIEHKYLEKGHTQMECDSAHSLIERHLKGRYIFLPTDYISVIRNARRKSTPLDVQYLNHSFFLNFEDPDSKRYNSLRPGKLKNDLKVADIKCIKYVPSGEMFYKAHYKDGYDTIRQRQKAIDVNINLKPLYTQRLQITKKKWEHLQEMKKVLPLDTHFCYDNLKCKQEDPVETKDSEKNADKKSNTEKKAKSSLKNVTKSKKIKKTEENKETVVSKNTKNKNKNNKKL